MTFIQELNEPETPKPDVKIWRYMEVARLIETITKGTIHLANVSTFQDNHEHRVQGEIIEKIAVGLSPAESEQYREKSKDVISKAMVSYWHENDHESIAMWRIFAPGGCGAAIQTTVQGFREALQTDQPVAIRRVQYIDYHREIPNLNSGFGTLLCKRKMFDFEKEIRAIVLNDEPWQHAKITVNTEKLIEQIRLARESIGHQEVIKHLLKEKKINIPIRTSEEKWELVGSVHIRKPEYHICRAEQSSRSRAGDTRRERQTSPERQEK